MTSIKFLFFILCVLCSLVLLCDSFKLHLNRDLKEKSSIDAKPEKHRFKPTKAEQSFEEDDESDETIEEESEEVDDHDEGVEMYKKRGEVKTDKLKIPIVIPKKPVLKEEAIEENKFEKKTILKKDVEKTQKEKETIHKIDSDLKRVKLDDEEIKFKDVGKTAPIKKDKQQEKVKVDVEIPKADDLIKKASLTAEVRTKESDTKKVKPEVKPEKDKKISAPAEEQRDKETTAASKKKEELKKQEEPKKQETKTTKSDDIKIYVEKSEKPPPPTVKKDTATKQSEKDPSKPDTSSASAKLDSSSSNMEQEQFDILYKSLPSFAPDYSIVKNAECRRQGQIFLRQLRGHKLWALQILDASAKIPAGILRGNVNQLGDFDACLEASARVKVHQDKPAVAVRGKYCLAEMDFAAVAEGARYPVHLMQARNFIRSNRKDTGHFIPKFTTVNWALCLPSACTHEDAEQVLLHAIAPYNITTGLKISLGVREDMCYTKKHTEWFNTGYETLATLGFYSIIVLIACLATLKDCWQSWTDVASIEQDTNAAAADELKTENKQNDGALYRMFMAFSIKRSGEDLMKHSSSDGDIECIHGIRAITTLILYCAHKLLPLARIPFSNRTHLTEIANSQWSVILRISLIYTDTFLLLSGVLSAYNMSKDMMNKGQISWFSRLLSRYIRLTPALLAVLLFYAYIWDHIGSGPQWTNVVTANARLCQDNMWMNILYIQNFFPFEEMCATHTHQLALDMQLTILAPILVWFLYKRPFWGLAILGGLHSLSVGLRYFATLNHRLSLVIFHGMSLSQLIRTANFSYASAMHRATPYLTGVGLGVLLKNTGKGIHLPKIVVALGWMSALYFFGWTFNAPAHLAKRDYQYDVKEAAQISASASVSWALALSWLIFACYTDNGGSINSFLCSRPLVLLSRISYSIYLIQFIIFFYNVGTYRSSTVFDIMQSFDVVEFATVIIFSIVVTVLFDSPMKVIKSVLMKSSNRSTSALDISVAETATGNIEERDCPSDQEEQVVEEILQSQTSSMDAHQELLDDEEVEPENIEAAEEAEEDPQSEGLSYDPNSDLYDYEYEDEDEETTDPNTEKEVGPDDQDLQDWEWTEDDKPETPEKPDEES